MGLQVVHGNQGLSQHIRQPFGMVESHQKRPHQTRSHSDGNAVQVRHTEPRVFQSFIHHGHDISHMLPGSQFGDHPAVGMVNGHLRMDHIGQGSCSIVHNAGGCIITGCIDA